MSIYKKASRKNYFTCGCLLSKNDVITAQVPEDNEIYEEYSQVTWWKNNNGTSEIIPIEINDYINSITEFNSEDEDFHGAVALGINGNVFFLQEGQLVDKEIIAESEKWGYLMDIRQIEKHLYACGDRGQVYKRISKNHWEHIDDGLISKKNIHDVLIEMTNNGPKPGENFGNWILGLADRKIEEKNMLWSIAGLSEDNIYSCGSKTTSQGMIGILFHYNGKQWDEIDIPETESLGAIFFDNMKCYISGDCGHLLKNNLHDKFTDISKNTDLMHIGTIAKHNNLIYLGTSDGLYQLDGNEIKKSDLIKHDRYGVSIYSNERNLLAMTDTKIYLCDARTNVCKTLGSIHRS